MSRKKKGLLRWRDVANDTIVLLNEARTRLSIEREDRDQLIAELGQVGRDLINERTLADELRNEVKMLSTEIQMHLQTISSQKAAMDADYETTEDLRESIDALDLRNQALKNEVSAFAACKADLVAECALLLGERNYWHLSYERLVEEAEKRTEYVGQLEYANKLLMNYLADEHEARDIANNVIKNKEKHIEMLNKWRNNAREQHKADLQRDACRIKALENKVEFREAMIDVLESEIRSLKE